MVYSINNLLIKCRTLQLKLGLFSVSCQIRVVKRIAETETLQIQRPCNDTSLPPIAYTAHVLFLVTMTYKQHMLKPVSQEKSHPTSFQVPSTYKRTPLPHCCKLDACSRKLPNCSRKTPCRLNIAGQTISRTTSRSNELPTAVQQPTHPVHLENPPWSTTRAASKYNVWFDAFYPRINRTTASCLRTFHSVSVCKWENGN